jgi:hypothetical protein
MNMNSELVWIWKEALVACKKVPVGNAPAENGENSDHSVRVALDAAPAYSMWTEQFCLLAFLVAEPQLP